MKERLSNLLTKIVQNNALHAKWLNTLSYLENCGARKIAACEHPTLVKEEMLKHASEEFRHSHYLKRQIKKISPKPFPNFSQFLLLGGIASLNYINALDLFTSRFLIREIKLPLCEVKKTAYILVTYAIELRAQMLYPLYDRVLRTAGSNVFVKSIILEEEEHLHEMKEGLKMLVNGSELAKKITLYEAQLFNKWIEALENETYPHLAHARKKSAFMLS